MKAGFRNQIICTSIVYLTYMLVGITRGFPNLIPQQPAEKKALLNDSDISWIASICVLVNPVGSTIAGILMDSFGRIPTLKISTSLFAISWFAIALTSTKVILFIAFSFVGISIGMLLTSSVYVAEISCENNRCVLLSLFIVFFTSGILVSYIITLYLPLKAACWVFAALSAGICWLFFFLQESPHWLAKKGKKTEAIRVLRKICVMTEAEAEKEYDAVLLGFESTTKKSKTFVQDVLRSWKPFAIMVLFQICLQGSGYSLLITYSSKIFENISLPIEKNSMTISYSLAVFVSSFFAPFASIYGSRRMLMTISSLGMTVTLILMLMCIWYEFTWCIPIEVYMYVFFCTIGIVTLSECLPSEIYRTEVRGFMCGITQAFTTVMQGTLIKIFPGFVTESSIYVLSTFALFSFVSFLFGIYVVPETKGKTLQEIQEEYFVKKPAKVLEAGTINKEKDIYVVSKEKEQICRIVAAVSDKNELRNL